MRVAERVVEVIAVREVTELRECRSGPFVVVLELGDLLRVVRPAARDEREELRLLRHDVLLELGAERDERVAELRELGAPVAMGAHDLLEEAVEARELLAQVVVVGGDDVVAQLGERRARPVALARRGAGDRLQGGDGVVDGEPARVTGGAQALLAATAVVDAELLEHAGA